MSDIFILVKLVTIRSSYHSTSTSVSNIRLHCFLGKPYNSVWLQLYAKSDKCNPKTCTFCCRHCPNCNRSSFSQIDLEIDFEQDKSMTIRGSAPCGEVHLNKSVIDLSMKQLIQKVSLTGSLQRGRNNVGRCTFTKVSLTSQ